MALFGEPGHKPLDEILSADENASGDDQRERPRFGPVEQIANIAYEALRKHKDSLPEPPEELQKTGT